MTRAATPTADRQRPERPVIDGLTIGCFTSYAVVGWSMSGMGAVLPFLRDSLGSTASFYPSMPGAGLLLLALASQAGRAGRAARTARSRALPTGARLGTTVAVLGALHVAGLIAMVGTGAGLVSLAGALVMGLSAASLIRTLPAALRVRHPHHSVSVLTRANAWSSLAGIAAPLAVGLAVRTGTGWQLGLTAAPIGGAAAVFGLVRRAARNDRTRPQPDDADHLDPGLSGAGSDEVVSPHRPWIGPWVVLALSIVVEFAFVYFAATYLKEDVGMSPAGSAAGAAGFAIGMAAGRFLAGPVPALGHLPLSAYLGLIGSGFALMWLVATPVSAVAGITLAGAGTALLYPRGIDRLLGCFPPGDPGGATRGALASGVALLASPALLGLIRAVWNVRVAYLAVPVLLAILLAVDVIDRARQEVSAAAPISP